MDTNYNQIRRSPEECTLENDQKRLDEFSTAMVEKWQKGRREHGTVVKIDPLEEAMKECIDIGNYAMDTYFRLKELRKRLLGGSTVE